MKVDSKSLHFLHKLRLKYEAQGFAFDALLYCLMGEDAQHRVKETLAFLRTPEGEDVYAQVARILDPERVYDFDEEKEKARKSSIPEFPMTPELLLREVKRISA